MNCICTVELIAWSYFLSTKLRFEHKICVYVCSLAFSFLIVISTWLIMWSIESRNSTHKFLIHIVVESSKILYGSMLTRGKKHYRNMPSTCSEFHLRLCDSPTKWHGTVSLILVCILWSWYLVESPIKSQKPLVRSMLHQSSKFKTV